MQASLTIHVSLGRKAADALRRPINGSGGFQDLLRNLQAHLSNQNELVLTPDMASRIARYVQHYGQGGFQGRLGPVLTELTALARALEPMAA